MRRITALKLQRRNKERVNVYLDGEFAFGLARIVAAWLEVGQELSEAKIAELLAKDGIEVAYQRALRFISYRPRAEKEVSDNLRKHDVPEETIDLVMERLRDKNYVNDQQFAALWVDNRNEFRPRGRRALRAELRQKGIQDATIENTLEDLDEETLAYQAAAKKARRYRELEYQDFRKKLSGFLARRGFNYGIISNIIPRVWEETAPAQDNENETESSEVLK